MDHFQFKPFLTGYMRIPDILGESQIDNTDAVWGSDGASITVPDTTEMADAPMPLDLTASDFLFG